MTLFLNWTLTFVECGSGPLLRICLEVQNMLVSLYGLRKRQPENLTLWLCTFNFMNTNHEQVITAVP